MKVGCTHPEIVSGCVRPEMQGHSSQKISCNEGELFLSNQVDIVEGYKNKGDRTASKRNL